MVSTLAKAAALPALAPAVLTRDSALTQPALRYLTQGTRAGWIDLTPRVLTGVVTNIPTSLFTGDVAATTTNFGFIFAKNRAAFANTFGSSYGSNDWYDYCANVRDSASRVRVYYREADPTPVQNTTESTA